MNRKMKMVAGLILALAVSSLAFLPKPTLAYANGETLQQHERTMLQDGSCEGDAIQEREQLRLQEQDCNAEMLQECEQERTRERDCDRDQLRERERLRERFRTISVQLRRRNKTALVNTRALFLQDHDPFSG